MCAKEFRGPRFPYQVNSQVSTSSMCCLLCIVLKAETQMGTTWSFLSSSVVERCSTQFVHSKTHTHEPAHVVSLLRLPITLKKNLESAALASVWHTGKVEQHKGVWSSMLTRVVHHKQLTCKEDVRTAMVECNRAKNPMARSTKSTQSKELMNTLSCSGPRETNLTTRFKPMQTKKKPGKREVNVQLEDNVNRKYLTVG